MCSRFRVISWLFVSVMLLSVCSIYAAGKTIRIITFDAPSASVAMEKMAPTIKAETGIDLVVETLPVPNMYEKEALAASGKTGEWDIFCYDNAWGAEFSVPGWLVNLDPYLARDPNAIKIDDFISTFRDAFKHPLTGAQYGIPWYADCQVIFYRKDFFNNPEYKAQFKAMFGRELTPPKTNLEFHRSREILHQEIQSKFPHRIRDLNLRG